MNRLLPRVTPDAQSSLSLWPALAILLSGCGSPAQVPVDPEVATVVVLPNDEPLVSMGQDVQLSVRVTTTTGGILASPVIEWSTDKASVLTVTSSGLMTGQSDGAATVTATVEGRTGSQTFRVVDLTGTWTGGESPDTVDYVLSQTGTSVTGTFQSRLGFPPITNVTTGSLTGSLSFERYEHTLTLTTETGCVLSITGAHALAAQTSGELVLGPSGSGTLSSSNCPIMGTIDFTTLRRP